MKFKRQNTTEEGVNLTPLIDVVFLLLIFFMVSTTFTKESHLTIDLPQAKGEFREEKEPKQLEVLINAKGEFSLNNQVLINNSLRTVKAAISKESGGDNSLPLIITADAHTPHEAVVRAMDAAGQLGFVHLSITTRFSTKYDR